jgi:hypothetical protein
MADDALMVDQEYTKNLDIHNQVQYFWRPGCHAISGVQDTRVTGLAF